MSNHQQRLCVNGLLKNGAALGLIIFFVLGLWTSVLIQRTPDATHQVSAILFAITTLILTKTAVEIMLVFDESREAVAIFINKNDTADFIVTYSSLCIWAGLLSYVSVYEWRRLEIYAFATFLVCTAPWFGWGKRRDTA